MSYEHIHVFYKDNRKFGFDLGIKCDVSNICNVSINLETSPPISVELVTACTDHRSVHLPFILVPSIETPLQSYNCLFLVSYGVIACESS